MAPIAVIVQKHHPAVIPVTLNRSQRHRPVAAHRFLPGHVQAARKAAEPGIHSLLINHLAEGGHADG